MPYLDLNLEFVRDNNPDYYGAYIPVGCIDAGKSDLEWPGVMSENDYVQDITLDFRGGCSDTGSHWDSLQRAIAAREILKKISFRDDEEAEKRNSPLVTSFLHAIQGNHAIQTVILSNVRVSGASIAAFLDATSVTTLELSGCDMEPSEINQGVRELAASLQCNTTIQTLSVWLSYVYLVPIIESLASNECVKVLRYRPWHETETQYVESSVAIQRLLESSSSIEGFEFAHWNIVTNYGDVLKPIVEGLVLSESVTYIMFEDCLFRDELATTLVKVILQYKSNLRSLHIRSCDMHAGTVPVSVFTNLLRPASLLRYFELSYSNMNASLLYHWELVDLLEAVEKSPLKFFTIGRIKSQEQRQALIRSIPKMQVKMLEFEVHFKKRRLTPALVDFKSDIIQAVKRNTSLHTIVGKLYNNARVGELFNEDEREEIVEQCLTNCMSSNEENSVGEFLFNEEEREELASSVPKFKIFVTHLETTQSIERRLNAFITSLEIGTTGEVISGL